MTKQVLLLIALITIISTSNAQQNVPIIPQPNFVALNDGATFELTSNTALIINDQSKKAANSLVNYLKEEKQVTLNNSGTQSKNQIVFVQNISLNDDAYQMDISTDKIKIQASSEQGFFYAVQSLRQLTSQTLELKAMTIKDEPRFSWRAYMLDESRYFQGETFVKKLLDEMALLKLNIFHWHLTDDGGWRIEIKKYPKLTEIGSKRKDSEIGTWKSGKTAGEPHGGFYTQEQIKNIVAYAAERHITIVPEFEMPGHSSSAIAAYTWLGTAGKEIEVPVKFGRHYDNYDVTNPRMQQFAKDVLDEIIELFPSEVIHIGGDEVGYKVWNESEHVQKYMKEKGLNTAADLQIYFTNTISKYIESKGRRMMGWNEIMGKNIHKGFEEKKDDKEAETSLAQNTVVHFWKGNLELATEAAQKDMAL